MSSLDTSRSSDSSFERLDSTSPPPWQRVSQWTRKTVKVTRQFFRERWNQTIRTQDRQLEEKIQIFRQTKSDYEHLWKLARQLTRHFSSLLQTEQFLNQSLLDLQRSLDDTDPQPIFQSNGVVLLNSLQRFVDGLDTLINKSMQDTLDSILHYEQARMEYDAYRSDYEGVLARNPTGGVSLNEKEERIESEYEFFKEQYERYQREVNIKLQLIDENRIKVMKEQLQVFQRCICNFYS